MKIFDDHQRENPALNKTQGEAGLNRPLGTRISKRAPFSGSPLSRMVIPVIARISPTKKRPRPVCFPNPFPKMSSLSVDGTPRPLPAERRIVHR
jgi:hypothetical protein